MNISGCTPSVASASNCMRCRGFSSALDCLAENPSVVYLCVSFSIVDPARSTFCEIANEPGQPEADREACKRKIAKLEAKFAEIIEIMEITLIIKTRKIHRGSSGVRRSTPVIV